MALTRIRQTVIAMALNGMAVFAGIASGGLMQAAAQEAVAPSGAAFSNTKWDMSVTWGKTTPIKGNLMLKDGGAALFTYEDGKKHLDGTWSGTSQGDLRISFSSGSLDYKGKRDGEKLSGSMTNAITKAKGGFTATLAKPKT